MPVSQQVKQAFSAGTTILTSTVRAARWLRREYALEQRAAERRVWATPPIFDWDTWLRERWQAIALRQPDSPLLLTSPQERRVWTRVLGKDADEVVSAAGIAALAEGAYSLLSSYEAHVERKRLWGETDAARFRRWAADFDAECARKGWLPQAELEKRVGEALPAMELPAGVLLVGFDRTTPAQERLLETLSGKGMSIAFLTPASPGQAEYIRSSGLKQEIEESARWVRDRLLESPEARIGVLAPDLATTRSELERTFRCVLMPQADGIFADQAMPFEFSLGLPLADLPVVRAALLLLRWLHEPLFEEEVTWLLLSGFLQQDSTDFLKLSRLDAYRRKEGALSLEVSLPAFLKEGKVSTEPALARLRAVYKAAEASSLEDEQRLPGRWTDLAQLLLREAGWPGAAERDTLHFQALRRWERVLDEIALLDFDGQRIHYSQFLAALLPHVQEVLFAPESEGAPVQIMGALEASGQQFDAIWFLSADDQGWPLRGRPHPLLPRDVQRRYGMPYANPDNDLTLAQHVTGRIISSAPELVFSYAERNKDGEMRPSPLLSGGTVWRAADEVQTITPAPALDTVEEDAEVAVWPQSEIAGGSEVLKEQAACPFQAFASKRLSAEALNRNEWGLSAKERGNLLHDVLGRIWMPGTGALHTLEELQAAIRDDQLDEILRMAIAEGFARYDHAEGWERAYIESEKRRLQTRLRLWLKTEAERAPFAVIAGEERLDHVCVGELKLRLRVDRVDELGNGGRVLIDYKSGEVKTRDWDTPRPTEPQLPLYAVFGGVEDVRGVLFGKIRAGEEKPVIGCIAGEEVKVLADESKNKKLANHPYDAARRAAWEEELRRLADDFLRGDAVVDPRDGNVTCSYCQFQGLCRIAELGMPMEDSEAEDEDGDE
ncbi:MAG TPA: PD-(D/E)XK nuclease family protein [Acidobacteriaceae bacterium]|nr:PD-(D/E)XK nuclease family protein [Acidobacteriaceae bacterium]